MTRSKLRPSVLSTPEDPRPLAAVYTRFSTDGQKPTSTADQVRNAVALAEAKGYRVPPELVFSDEAISGQFHKLDKREGYARLIKAWEAGQFAAVFADEVTRLARDDVELALLKRKVLTTGVHLFTVDGTDSTRHGWTLLFGIKSVMAAEDLVAYAQRSRRGMLGAVLRGYQVGTPPFGYRPVKDIEGVRVIGTRFEIDEDQAQHVRLAFTMRAAGASLNDIAERFNKSCVPARSRSRPGMAYWRPAQVRALLSTTFYAGYFLYPVTDEATGKVTDTRFERPQLRIVSDDLFNACQSRKGSKFTPLRGGVSHYLAGLVRCGVCGNTLRLQHDPKRAGPAMRCAQCETRRQSGLDVQAPYVSSVGLELALKDAISQALTPEVAELFRSRLSQRITGGVDAEIAQISAELDRSKSSTARLARLLATLDRDDLTLEAEYRRLLSEQDELTRKLYSLRSSAPAVDKAALRKQLALNPARLLNRVFSATDPAALGARLRRFFTSITLLDKPDRFTARYSLCFVPGAIAAELTATPTVDLTPVCLTYTVKQRRVAGGKVQWEVSR